SRPIGLTLGSATSSLKVLTRFKDIRTVRLGRVVNNSHFCQFQRHHTARPVGIPARGLALLTGRNAGTWGAIDFAPVYTERRVATHPHRYPPVVPGQNGPPLALRDHGKIPPPREEQDRGLRRWNLD